MGGRLGGLRKIWLLPLDARVGLLLVLKPRKMGRTLRTVSKAAGRRTSRPQESSRHRSTPPSAHITPLLAQDSWSSFEANSDLASPWSRPHPRVSHSSFCHLIVAEPCLTCGKCLIKSCYFCNHFLWSSKLG